MRPRRPPTISRDTEERNFPTQRPGEGNTVYFAARGAPALASAPLPHATKKVSMASELQLGGRQQASGLVDVLDRVLDKGLVVAGDIKVSLAEVELLTVRLPLLVVSIH